MTEETENTEEIIEEIAEETGDDGFSALSPDAQNLMERMGTKLGEPEAEEEVVEEVIEEEVATDAPAHIFELEDGTKVTADEAKAGYLRHSDYTQKSQANAEERKKTEQYGKIISRMENDPKLTKMVIDYMVGGQDAPKPQATTSQVQAPAGYENEPAIKLLVDELNKTRGELAQLSGDINTTKQETVQERQQASQKELLDSRLAEGYEYLKGQVGTLPAPKEYVEKIQQYVTEQGLDPQVVVNYILSGDPDYLRAKIDGAFKADIDASKADKANSGEKERKKRVATTQTLRVAGKSKTAAPQPLPKGPDGKRDLKKSLIQIMDAQDAAARR